MLVIRSVLGPEASSVLAETLRFSASSKYLKHSVVKCLTVETTPQVGRSGGSSLVVRN